MVRAGPPGGADPALVRGVLSGLGPWRKGPFEVFGARVDAEWRSDLKWDRVEGALPDLAGKAVLDVGCNNGYFMFRVAERGPGLVLGVDPMMRPLAQFRLVQRIVREPALAAAPLGVADLVHFRESFDAVLSMGVVYHHRDPLGHLASARGALRRGGTLVLETLGVPGDGDACLFPEGRYARMRNVWFVPTMGCLVNWARRSRFRDVEAVSDTALTTDEQRATPWSSPASLADALDPDDPTRTVEGHPAPRRLCVVCRK